MRIVHGLEALEPPLARSTLTIGNFDGVHRAHQQLLAQAGLFAANTGAAVVVLTFEPHPLTVVSPAKAPARLSTPDEKIRLLAEAGTDITVVARSDPALLALEPGQFVGKIIVPRFHPTHIVVGPSFGFGRHRKGTPSTLRRIAADYGCHVHTLEPVTLQIDEGETLMVSSSLIRILLADGKVRRAALCLGRSYALVGQVIGGDRRGRTMSIPTANVAVSDQLIPGDGVYAGHATVHDNTCPAAISVGSAPTFGGTERRIEAHLLDFDGDLYGEPIRVEFERRLRDQRTFASPAALVDQMQRDIAAVRNPQEAGGSGPTGD